MMIALVYSYLAVPLVYEFVYPDILLENVNYPVEREEENERLAKHFKHLIICQITPSSTTTHLSMKETSLRENLKGQYMEKLL